MSAIDATENITCNILTCKEIHGIIKDNGTDDNVDIFKGVFKVQEDGFTLKDSVTGNNILLKIKSKDLVISDSDGSNEETILDTNSLASEIEYALNNLIDFTIEGTLKVNGSVDINGGAIDGTVIGGTSAAAGTFTSLSVSNGNITNVGNIALDTISADDGSSFAFGSNWTAAGTTCADLGSVTTVDINGGTIDGTIIGGTSAAAGTFTNLTHQKIISTPKVYTLASTDQNSPTDLVETYSTMLFNLNSTSAMYGILADGTNGQLLNIFYHNAQSNGSLRIDFGGSNLRTGSGEARYISFTQIGQSASLIYLSTIDKWCIINTGAKILPP